jgi:hypothetical protein
MVELNKLQTGTMTKVVAQNGEILEIMPLGAGCEVGRSCIYL